MDEMDLDKRDYLATFASKSVNAIDVLPDICLLFWFVEITVVAKLEVDTLRFYSF